MRPNGNTLWNSNAKLVLASESAARKRLLQSCGIPFIAIAAEIDERKIEAEFDRQGGKNADIPVALARAKALAVSAKATDSLCIGADQVLILDGRIYHKSRSKLEALKTLEQLCGRTHQLISAFAIADNGTILQEGQDTAYMTMRHLEREQLADYLDFVGDDIFASVGSYQVEAAGIHLFSEIRGSHSTILGLPMLPLLAALRALRALNF